MSPSPVMVLLLAAGQSRRFGSDKRLFALNNGEPLAIQTARAYLSAGLPVTPVIRPEDTDDLGELFIAAGTEKPIASARAEMGMGYSLADAADCLIATSDHDSAAALLIALADMPYVRATTLEALAELGERSFNIVVPELQSADAGNQPRVGHPVRFPWSMLDELRQLSGDTGARSLFARHAQRLLKMPTDDPGVLQDIDYLPDASADKHPE